MNDCRDAKKFFSSIPEVLAKYEQSEQTALICGDEELSYRALVSDVKHIARALLERGVKKGDRVVLQMRRSADYVRMYLGVIFAGAVQVTLHSDWPDHQRGLAIEDCAPVLIVDDAMAKALRNAPLTGGEGALPVLSASDPFQIVYTSGSTGIPKGVVNTHLLPVAQLPVQRDSTDEETMLGRIVGSFQRMLMDANLAFAVSDVQIFLALFNEKTLVMATEKELKTPATLAACIRRTGVDALYGVLSRYSLFLSNPDFSSAIRDLRLILLTGERAIPKVVDAMHKASCAQIYDIYGSSEAFIMFGWQYQPDEPIRYDMLSDRLPIKLLESGGNTEVVCGEPGEICIGGPAGRYGRYWNAPALTGKKYKDHPVCGRLLRTGDSAVREADGRLRILGRLDRMAKLRGLRIELGAVESAMEDVPGVRRAVVTIQGEGHKALLHGYYEGTAGERELRHALAEALPYYMVPAFLRKLPELPLNLNGKLDHSALPPIQLSKGNYVPPETETEKLLCEAFRKVLRQDTSVGIDDSFFELGGDSIRGMTIGALVREQGYELKVEWIFAAPTPRALAQMLRPLAQEEDANEPLWSMELSPEQWDAIDHAVGRAQVEAVYPVLFHAKEYLRRRNAWMVHQCWVLDRVLSGDAFRERLEELTRCRTALRCVFSGMGTDHPLQVGLREAHLSVFEVDLRGLLNRDARVPSPRQEQYLQSLVGQLYRSQPDLSREVPFRLGLIHAGPETTILVCFFSHLLLDMAGIKQIIKDLLGDEELKTDAPLFGRYMGFLCQGEQNSVLDYWRRMTDGTEHFTRLPSGSGSASFVLYRASSGSALYEQAMALCNRRRVTVSALLHLAAGEALMELLGLSQVSFASTSSGRDARSARLAGMFIHHFPVLIRHEETLEAVQKQLLEGMRHSNQGTQALPEGLDLPGMARVLDLNVESVARNDDANCHPYWIGGKDTSEATMPPEGIRGHLTLMIFLEKQFGLSFYYSPSYIDSSFVKKFSACMLRTIRRIVERELE